MVRKEPGDNAPTPVEAKPIGRPFESGNPGRPKGTPNKISREIRKLIDDYRVFDRSYWRMVYHKAHLGTLDPRIEALLLQMRFGKPREHVTIEGMPNPTTQINIQMVLARLSPEALRELRSAMLEAGMMEEKEASDVPVPEK